jgi:fatty acid desaturase
MDQMITTEQREPGQAKTAMPTFESVRRDTIVDSRGVRYKEFKQTLTPRYGVVWTHILAGHLALLATGAGVVAVDARQPGLWPLTVVAGSILFGYILAYIQLFFHEASHYNLVKDRRRNDLLANIFIGSFVGQDIKAYRPIHFDHHRHLGTPADTEHSYFDPLNIRFIVESLTGIKPLKVLAKRDRINREKGAVAGGIGPQLIIGIVLNAAVVLGSAALGWWALAASWTIGILIVFPFLAAVRQLLEHRDENARSDVDYSVVPHGAVNRIFGSGPLSSTLGGAGFNRHLLHHWDPQVSYTRLRDLERFLLDTDLAGPLQERRTSYFVTFVRLFNRK